MKIEKYRDQKARLPKSGRQIIGATDGENVIVYQAFNAEIADYAVTNQQFGGSSYSYNRMSWIKPGFLWIMYRAGWATKENQERILALTFPIANFKTILRQATATSFDKTLFANREDWKKELSTEVRLQWDPDHDPYGNKEQRKAIQIGMKGDILRKFCLDWMVKIEDITNFVKEQHKHVLNNNLEQLNVPYEAVIDIEDAEILARLGIVKT